MADDQRVALVLKLIKQVLIYAQIQLIKAIFFIHRSIFCPFALSFTQNTPNLIIFIYLTFIIARWIEDSVIASKNSAVIRMDCAFATKDSAVKRDVCALTTQNCALNTIFAPSQPRIARWTLYVCSAPSQARIARWTLYLRLPNPGLRAEHYVCSFPS